MTARTAALSIGFLAAGALGVWIGPYVTDRDEVVAPTGTAVVAETPPGPPAAARPMTRQEPAISAIASVPASSTALQRRLKTVLNEGADPAIAAKDFRDGEEFAAVAHASRNLGVPFMVLKQLVVEDRMSLAGAIRELRPGVNAALEANRARIMARADIAAITLS
jgi:hypothetical protein